VAGTDGQSRKPVTMDKKIKMAELALLKIITHFMEVSMVTQL
jgi:hypothetical protein